MLYTLAHEYTHMMHQNAKESFDKLTELLFQQYRENGEDVDALILAKQERMDTDYDTAFEEFVADSMEAMLTDTNAAERIAGLKETDKTAWEKLKELVHKLLDSIKGLYAQYSPSSVEGKRVREMGDSLEKLSDLFVEGMSKVGEQGTSEGKISYQMRPQFTQEIDQWARNGKPDGETFILGSTGPVLQGLGAIENDIYMESEKINKILADHSEMTLDEIKKIPQILEDPALALKSRTKSNSIVVFGTYRAQNGQPILAAMNLRPTENRVFIDGMQKVASAYTKTGTKTKTASEVGRDFIMESDVLYADKKRTALVLRRMGIYEPISILQSGYIGSITYRGNKVNIEGVPFSKIVENDEKRFSMQDRDSSGRKLSQQQQEYFKGSQVRDGEGRLKPVFHSTYDTFTVFDRDKLGAITDGNASDEYLAATAHIGFWFNENDLSKQAYGDRSEEVYLNITSPYDAGTLDALAEQMKLYDGSAAEIGGDFAQWLRREGYDGIVLRDTEFEGTSYVALDPNQIKRTSNQTPTDSPDIRYQERGTSNREILTTALESAAQNPREREVLAEYKAAADKLETYETRLRENRAKVQELTAENEKKNARRIAKLKEDIKADENRVGNVTDQMETLENRESLRALLAREREAIVAQQQEQVRQLKERLDEYREKYGTFPGGEKAAREILLPRKSKDGQKISQTVRTILEASSTPEEAVPTIEEMALDGRFSYETYSDKESIADAESEIKRVGWAQSLSSWMSSIEKGNVSKQNTAMGWALYNNAANSGDTNTAIDILSHMVEHQRSAAQALQATRILKDMSPTTQLYQVQRSVENLQAELNKRFGDKKAPELKVDPELAEQFMAAEDQEGRDAAMRRAC